MAIAALLLWMCTAAVGGYLLATSARSALDKPAGLSGTGAAAPVRPARDRDRFDPPSLTRAKTEQPPLLRAFAEFTHPALAIIGLGLWLGYVMSRDRVFAAIGFGILLGAICAGLSWFAINTRAAKRTAAAEPLAAPESRTPLSFSRRLLILHAVGAALTLLLTALIAARA